MKNASTTHTTTLKTFRTDHQRYRDIVSLAAKDVQDSNTADWLIVDSEGKWELEAKRLLEKTAEQAKEKGMTEELVDSEIAKFMAYTALTAMLDHAKKLKSSKR